MTRRRDPLNEVVGRRVELAAELIRSLGHPRHRSVQGVAQQVSGSSAVAGQPADRPASRTRWRRRRPCRFTSVKRSLTPKGPMFLRIFEAGDYQSHQPSGREGECRGPARRPVRSPSLCLLVVPWLLGGMRRMAGRYGMSFAAKMIQEGKYAEAIEEATRAVARDDEDPAPLVERASAYAWLERYPGGGEGPRGGASRSTRRPACWRPTWSTTPTSARSWARRSWRRGARSSGDAYAGALPDDLTGRAPPGRRRGLARSLADRRAAGA